MKGVKKGSRVGIKGRPSRHYNKFLRVGVVKLCTGVILLSAEVIEGHQTID